MGRAPLRHLAFATRRRESCVGRSCDRGDLRRLLAALACDLLEAAERLERLIVARTTLCGFALPRHFVRMSWIPALSTTARTAPPAMTPVPAEAGLRKTSAGAEVTERLMRNRHAVERHVEDVLARLVVALADRLGNLVGFAETNAHVTGLVADDDERREQKRRPPLTTLATRLMWMTRSLSFSSSI